MLLSMGSATSLTRASITTPILTKSSLLVISLQGFLSSLSLQINQTAYKIKTNLRLKNADNFTDKSTACMESAVTSDTNSANLASYTSIST